MHPPLSSTKQERCGALIAALNECHARGMLHKLTGGCNGIKEQLTLCLREERLERTARNAAASAKQRERKSELWREIDEDQPR